MWFVRLVVPHRLRDLAGRTEYVQTTGTNHLAIAKVVASGLLAQWRGRLLDLDRLAMGDTATNHTSIIKIADGHPTLALSVHLGLDLAAAASGMSAEYLLKSALEGRIGLFWRSAGQPGYSLPLAALQPDDMQLGSLEVPHPARMPASANRVAPTGPLPIPSDALPGLVEALLNDAQATVSIVAFDTEAGRVFVPDQAIWLNRNSVEVAALEVDALRRALAATIVPTRLEAARAAQSGADQAGYKRDGKYAQRPLSEALSAYTKNKLRQDIASENEVKRVSTACGLLIELMGDLPVGEIDADLLRRFRDDRLSQVPAKENKVRLLHKTTSVSESIAAVTGSNWPVMTAGERNKRMDWIRAWFRWLKVQNWISNDPGAAISGESVLTAVESRAIRKRADQSRIKFEPEHLNQIFSTVIACTGKSRLSSSGKRTDSPAEYWLPLLGLYTGARISELCQLHLSDFGCTPGGTWYIDFNERTPDKRLKTPHGKARGKASPSLRIVPVHPILLELGLPEWISALRDAGYQRFFPELIYSHDKGYSKDMVKWFSGLLKDLGYARDSSLTFHSFRHTFVNALPASTPERLGNQLTGHDRGSSVRSKTYAKDVAPEQALDHLKLLTYDLPVIASFDAEDGLKAMVDALGRKQGARKGKEDMGPYRVL